MTRKNSNLEYRVLQMIKDGGPEGILQSQLWKSIKATSREGSRISLKLEKAGLIERHRVLHEGKWTYKLVAKKRSININSIIDIPCAFCVEQAKCDVGSEISPLTCKKLSSWVEKAAYEYNHEFEESS
ncbi:MAG: helix-turn-helix transcriptional regulator [Candidatus Bathyarchaeota archaeon]